MTITDRIILDLLPLYYAGEASQDTITLIESYLAEHPEFARKMDEFSKGMLPAEIPIPGTQDDKLIVLRRTKQWLRFRSSLFAFAIFFTALPFAFGDVSWSDIEGVHWLWADHPVGAMVSGLVAVSCWAAYFLTRRHLSVTSL